MYKPNFLPENDRGEFPVFLYQGDFHKKMLLLQIKNNNIRKFTDLVYQVG